MSMINYKRGKPPNNTLQLDITGIESELSNVARRISQQPTLSEIEYAPRQRREAPPLPEYVDHHAEVNEIGRLSAEAIVTQYETAAKEIEAMGDDLKDYARKLEISLKEIDAAFVYVQETAQIYRNEGKKIFERIEQASLLTSQVKEACEGMRKKVE